MVEGDLSDLQPLALRDVQLWKSIYWANLECRIAPFFAHSEARVRVLTYIGGLGQSSRTQNELAACRTQW
jgi:hypothetical protein